MSLSKLASIAAFVALFCTTLSAPEAEAKSNYMTVYIVAIVPEGTGDVWISGSHKILGPWDARGAKMVADGRKRIYVLEAKKGFALEYKFTAGSWSKEALDKNGNVPSNHRLKVWEDKKVYLHEISGFKGDG